MPIAPDLKNKLTPLLKKEGLFCILAPSDRYHEVLHASLSLLSASSKRPGIYVSLNTPYRFLVDRFKKDKSIHLENLYFIDGISKKSGEVVEVDNCTYLSGPHSLTELSLAIVAAHTSNDFGFLFFDSLSTLLIYNDLKMTEKFSFFLLNKLRNLNMKGIIFVLDESEGAKLVPTVSSICDHVIKI